MIRWFKRHVYAVIRPLFVAGVHRLEDYECVMCGEPVLRRQITCCAECTEKLNQTPWPGMPHE